MDDTSERIAFELVVMLRSLNLVFSLSVGHRTEGYLVDDSFAFEAFALFELFN